MGPKKICSTSYPFLTGSLKGFWLRLCSAMKICSCYIEGHDEAPELNEPLPTPADIELDIKNLEEYRLELSSKKKKKEF